MAIAPLLALGLAAHAAQAPPAGPPATLAERLSPAYLSALHESAVKLRALVRPSERSGTYRDVRAVLHIHSNLSHDSRGTEAQIVEGAREAGVQAVFMTEHVTPDRRWWTEGLRGTKDGVLVIPGAELSDGLLVWRSDGHDWTPDTKASDVLRRLEGTRAVTVVPHPADRPRDEDWRLPPFTGMEIYDCFDDAKARGFTSFLDGLKGAGAGKTLQLLLLVRRYPQEAFAAIFGEPVDALRRWDTLNREALAGDRHVVGVAGNDAHQNVGVVVVPDDADAEHYRIEDALGKKLGTIAKKSFPTFLLGSPTTEAPLAVRFDPYAVSFRYVCTHLLATDLSEDALFDALKSGRAYVAFDWMADSSGFRFAARAEGSGGETEMGGTVAASAHPVLTARADMPCRLRLLRDGALVTETTDGAFSYPVTQPGVYRTEAWLKIADEERPWIYSNPVYVSSR